MTNRTVVIPDIGDVSDARVLEVCVREGDRIALDDTLVILETDKATLDIPSPVSGRVISIGIRAGDAGSPGTVLAVIEPEDAAQDLRSIIPLSSLPAADQVLDQTSASDFDLAVIGAGPGGYSAAFRAADLGLKVVLIERHEALGGVCLNVGCIPSKALLHVAAVREEAERLTSLGVTFSSPMVDLERLRSFRSGVVGRLTSGLASMARTRRVEVIRGAARFSSANRLEVAESSGETRTIAFSHAVIATGSAPVRLPFLPNDPRIVTSTGALALPFIPTRMLVIGGGVIGLEMATIYSSLGARVDLVEVGEGLLAGVDRDLVRIWMKRNAHRFDRILTRTAVSAATAESEGVRVVFDRQDAEAGRYDLVLQAAGRRADTGPLNIAALGLNPRQDGTLETDLSMRTAARHVFAVGDVTGAPMLAHRAVHQGHVAAEAIAGLKAGFDASVIPSVAYTDPEIAWVGVTESAPAFSETTHTVARFPWAASGRAIANGADYGLTKLIFERTSGRIVGGAIIGPSAGDMIGEICLAIEMGADAVDIGRTIHPHPTLGETIGLAAEISLGVCTDMPPA